MIIAIYVLAGMLSGMLLGLLGVGGGLVVVPLLAVLLPYQNLAVGHTMQVAIATSLAIIAVTTITSIITHWQYGNIVWPIVKRIAPGSIVGGLAGAILAHIIPSYQLRIIFGVFVIVIALRFFIKLLKPQDKKSMNGEDEVCSFPGPMGLFFAGGSIAFISAVLGIGGGTFTVPYLRRHNMRMRNAVATSTACSLPVALAGTIGMTIAGHSTAQLLPYSTGYLYWPAFLIIASASMIFAVVGARLSRRVPTRILEWVFASSLLIAGIRMIWL